MQSSGEASTWAGPLGGTTAVLRALQLLPPGERQVVVLHHLQDMSVAQIAAHTARPVAAVQSDLDRGRARLAGALRQAQDTARVLAYD